MGEALPAYAQGLYYLVTGIWPILSLRTFMKVTGPKQDTWLVRTFGLLLAATAVGYLYGATDGTIPPSLKVMAIAQAAALAAAELYYVWKERISRIYLGDALSEVFLIVLWLLA